MSKKIVRFVLSVFVIALVATGCAKPTVAPTAVPATEVPTEVAVTEPTVEEPVVATEAAAEPADEEAAAAEEASPEAAEEVSVVSDKALKTVSIQIDGAAVPYYAPLYMAQEKGFFAEEGLNVEFYYAAAADIVKNVASGNVEFGFPNADAVVAARAQDIPVKVVSTTYQEGLGAIIFGADSGIKTPADLKGKKVAVTSLGSANYFQLEAAMKSVGMTVADVNVEIVGTGAILTALTQGQVDAIVFSKLRTIELNNQGFAAADIVSDQFLPSFGNVLISSEKLIADDPATVDGFVKALNKGIEYVINNVEESVDYSIEKMAPTFADRRDVVVGILNEVFVKTLWQSDYTKANGIGASDVEKWQKLIDNSKEYGTIDKAFSASDLLYIK